MLTGDHGPMADLATDADLGRLPAEFHDSDKVVGALCHGPAGLSSALRPDGSFVFAGRRMAVFTDEEEKQSGLDVPYSMAGRLAELGALPEPGPAWGSEVVVDGNPVTGRNPRSSVDTARQLVASPT